MALALPILITDIQTAFTVPSWATCATLLTTAVDTFILSGTPQATVTATVYPPSASPYQVIDSSQGKIVTSQQAALYNACISAFTSITWTTVGPTIANGINTLFTTAILNMIESPPVSAILIGQGIGSVSNANLPILSTALQTAFVTGIAWAQTATNIANAINTYVTTAIINTSDSGTTPINSWIGTGIGSII